MRHLKVSHKRAQAISLSLLLIGLAIVGFTNTWWPGIMPVIGISIALRQYLLGHFRDMAVSLIVFIGFFIFAQFDIPWRILIPVLFITAAVYIICREFIGEVSYRSEEDSAEEDLNEEFKDKK